MKKLNKALDVFKTCTKHLKTHIKSDKVFANLQQFVPQESISSLAGALAKSEDVRIKTPLIQAFSKFYHINLDEYPRKIDEYKSFNDFFTREIDDDARPIDYSANGIICPADGSISQIGCIKNGTILQAKGKNFSLSQLLASNEVYDFEDGSFATIYLAPSNYHRVHMPFSGTLTHTRYIPGKLFSVNAATADHIPDLFARNERLVCLFDTEFGKACVILVGAMIVAGIECVATGKITRQKAIKSQTHHLALQKGDELGRFYLGSTAIVLLPKQASISWQSDKISGISVKMGQLLGVSHAQ